MKVDFIPRDDVATGIYLLDASGSILGAYAAHTPTGLTAIVYTGEELSMWGYFRKVIANSFNGEGRARRKEFWSFCFFLALFLWVPTLLLLPIMMNARRGYGAFGTSADTAFGVATIVVLLIALVSLALLPAMITLAIRRLHDIGMSGLALFAGAIPFFGGLFLMVCYLMPSNGHANRYGPVPKRQPASAS